MEQTYSVVPILRTQSRLQGKRATIMIRITVGGQRAELSLKRKVEADRWDSRANRVKGSKEDAREINALIETYLVKLNRIHRTLLEDGEIITAEKIKELCVGDTKPKKSLIEVFILHNEMMKSRVGVDFSKSTFTRYSTTLDHIQNLLDHTYNKSDVLLQQLQYSSSLISSIISRRFASVITTVH